MKERLKVSDVAKLYKVDYATIQRWCKKAGLPFIATPSGKRFDLEQLQEWERGRTFNTPKAQAGGESPVM